MKKRFALILVATGLFLLGLAYAAPFSDAASADVVVPAPNASVDADAPILLAEYYGRHRVGWWSRDAYSEKCLCCWYEYPSEKCRSMPLKNCAQRGGKCKD